MRDTKPVRESAARRAGRRLLLIALVAAPFLAVPASARSVDAGYASALNHISAVVLLQRFAQAIYRFLPPATGDCPETDTGFVDNGDGTFTREIQTADCTRITIRTLQGFSSDYDIETVFSNGLTESLQARTIEEFNGGPGRVRFTHRFSSGDRVTYDQILHQEAAIDPGFGGESAGGARGQSSNGGTIPGLNFLYGLESRGRVKLSSGQCLDFNLKQTMSFDCFNFFNNTELPPEICDEWFDHVPGKTSSDGGFVVPKPDRLSVTLSCGLEGELSLEIPILDPFGGVVDWSRPSVGALRLGGEKVAFSLTTPTPDVPGWRFWATKGKNYKGLFELGDGFSGRGQAYITGGRGSNRRRLHFAAAWSQRGIGTIILGNGQTRAGGATGGALEFGSLKWSGLSSSFGPSPGF